MKVKVLRSGTNYDAALFGLGLSYGVTSGMSWEDFEMQGNAPADWEEVEKAEGNIPTYMEFTQMKNTAHKLCKKDGGHNKFLESIDVALDITAPRYWWQQFDAYRCGITKQSESTMHTITKKELTQEDFEDKICEATLDMLNREIEKIISLKSTGKILSWGSCRGATTSEMKLKYRAAFNAIKTNLPESFLQRRIVVTNYKVLKTMYDQRKNHDLKQWHIFLDTVKEQIQFPELVFGDEK